MEYPKKQDSFEISGSQFLDRAMPLPVLVMCSYVVLTGEHRLMAAVFGSIFLVGNFGLNRAIQEQVANQENPGPLLGVARACLSLFLLPPLAWAAGPSTQAWLIAVPALVAFPFLLRFRYAIFAELTLISTIVIAWQRFAPTEGTWLAPTLAMAAVVAVCVPLAEAMRQRGHRLVEITGELREATQAATQALETKSKFLSHMSHELRTPLGAITGYTSLLNDPRTDPTLRADAINVIQRNSEHLVDLVNQVLDLAKIEAGELLIDLEMVSIQSVVEDVASLMRVQAKAKGLEFVVEYTTKLPNAVKTDAFRLKQILLNLVGNAIKFTKRGKVLIRVSMGEMKETLFIEVIDEGIGIPTQTMETLFLPFIQADASTNRQFGGTGLGLAISHQLAELLGGRLGAESQVGSGSCFRLSLFFAKAQQVEEASAPVIAASKQSDEEAAISLAGIKILLAEDFADSARLIALHLEQVGATVIIVENGEEALAAVEEGTARFHIVLMDMQMPVLDGYSATMALRAKNESTPIIALTAHAMAGERERCLQAGCDAYVTKPIDFGLLLRTISQQLKGLDTTSQEASAPHHPKDMKETLERLGAAFQSSLPENLAALQSAWEARQLDDAISMAHKLSGSAGMFGMSRLGEIAQALERAIQNGEEGTIVEQHLALLSQEVSAPLD